MNRFLFLLCLIDLIFCGNVQATEVQKSPYDKIYRDTLNGLEAMRDKDTSIMPDKVNWIRESKGAAPRRELTNLFMPTNQAIDLMLLLNQNTKESQKKVTQIVDQLSNMERFSKDESKFFYLQYLKNDSKGYTKSNREVSSVDNLHLAVALWYASEKSDNPKTQSAAKELFKSMKFDPFINETTGLAHLAYVSVNNAPHIRHGQPYDFWGAETRSIYALGVALQLSDSQKNPREYAKKLIPHLKIECRDIPGIGPIVQTWDGGAFQFMLPEILFNESDFSPTMKQSFQNYSKFQQAEEKRRGHGFAPSISASQTCMPRDFYFKGAKEEYCGKIGFVALSADQLRNEKVEGTDSREHAYTPHALILNASLDPNAFRDDVKNLMRVNGKNASLYDPNIGFMDAYHVEGRYKDLVVPSQLSLDQGMIALATEKILSPDNMTGIARLIHSKPEMKSRLKEFYAEMDLAIENKCLEASKKSKATAEEPAKQVPPPFHN